MDKLDLASINGCMKWEMLPEWLKTQIRAYFKERREQLEIAELR